MYTFPGEDSVGRTYEKDSAGVRMVYPTVDCCKAPPEVEFHSPSAVRIRVPFRAPDNYDYLGKIITKNDATRSTPGEKTRQIKNVREFDLFFTLPRAILRDPELKCPGLVIMLNGLNEIGPWSSNLYDLIGTSLATRGVAAVLLPSPFHLNRTPQKWQVTPEQLQSLGGEPAVSQPLTENLEHPTDCNLAFAPYFNFAQTFSEIDSLIRFVHSGKVDPPNPFTEAFFGALFNEHTRISLFGYSLGGLRVLAKFLLEQEPDKFYRAVLLCSGSTVGVLSPPNLKPEERKRWVELIESANPADIIDKINQARSGDAYVEDVEYIRSIFFDGPKLDRKLRDRLGTRGTRIRVILGREDKEVSAEASERLSNVHIDLIAGMSHKVIDDPIFYWLYDHVVQLIANSVVASAYSVTESPPPRYLDAREELIQVFRDAGVSPRSGEALWETLGSLSESERNKALEKVIQLFAYYHSANEIAEAVRRNIQREMAL